MRFHQLDAVCHPVTDFLDDSQNNNHNPKTSTFVYTKDSVNLITYSCSRTPIQIINVCKKPDSIYELPKSKLKRSLKVEEDTLRTPTASPVTGETPVIPKKRQKNVSKPPKNANQSSWKEIRKPEKIYTTKMQSKPSVRSREEPSTSSSKTKKVCY